MLSTPRSRISAGPLSRTTRTGWLANYLFGHRLLFRPDLPYDESAFSCATFSGEGGAVQK